MDVIRPGPGLGEDGFRAIGGPGRIGGVELEGGRPIPSDAVREGAALVEGLRNSSHIDGPEPGLPIGPWSIPPIGLGWDCPCAPVSGESKSRPPRRSMSDGATFIFATNLLV